MHSTHLKRFLVQCNKGIAIAMMLTILLSACGESLAPTVVSITASPVITQAQLTTVPTLSPTATPAPASLPTLALPYLQGTPLPTPAGPFAPQPGNKLVQLAHWGKRVLNDSVLSPDNKILALVPPAEYICMTPIF